MFYKPHSLNNTIKGSHKKNVAWTRKKPRPLFLALSVFMDFKVIEISVTISEIVSAIAILVGVIFLHSLDTPEIIHSFGFVIETLESVKFRGNLFREFT